MGGVNAPLCLHLCAVKLQVGQFCYPTTPRLTALYPASLLIIHAMKNDPAVSVIVPVYNSAPWVARCVRSLMEQTLDRVEYVFVDDRGDDGSMEIIAAVAAEYPERAGAVKVVRNASNIGAGLSRRRGVAECSGEYVCFVDADDTIEPEMLADMLSLASRRDDDMVYCAITEHGVDGRVREIRSTAYTSEQQMVTDLFSGLCLNLVLCSKLIKRSVISAPDFPWPDIRSHEDAVTCFPLWLKSFGKCSYTDHAYYHYHRHTDSLSLPTTIAARERYMTEHEVACKSFMDTLRKAGKVREYGDCILWKRLTVWAYWAAHGFADVRLSPRMRWLSASICRDVMLGANLSWRFKLSYLRRHLPLAIF